MKSNKFNKIESVLCIIYAEAMQRREKKMHAFSEIETHWKMIGYYWKKSLRAKNRCE